MAHPRVSCAKSAKRFGSVKEGYQPLHNWMDFSKGHLPTAGTSWRCITAWGIFTGERIFDVTLTRASEGKPAPVRMLPVRMLPVRMLPVRHLEEHFGGTIPTLAECFKEAPE